MFHQEQRGLSKYYYVDGARGKQLTSFSNNNYYFTLTPNRAFEQFMGPHHKAFANYFQKRQILRGFALGKDLK